MESHLLQRSASLVRTAAQKTAEDILKEKTATLTTLMAHVLPSLMASILSAFSTQFALACLRAITNEQESKRLLQQIDKLVTAPLQTGLVQLRTALALETNPDEETVDQRNYRATRYSDALRKLDEALVLAKDDEEQACIHLYRAIASTRIPGGEKEAQLHAAEFATSCEAMAASLILRASEEEQAAKRNATRAAEIAVDRGMGGGGGAVGWSMAEDKIKKSQLEYTARSQAQNAIAMKIRADEVLECSRFLSAVI